MTLAGWSSLLPARRQARFAMLLAAAWLVTAAAGGEPVAATAFPPQLTPDHGVPGTVVHVELRVFGCPVTSAAALGKLPPIEQDPNGAYIAKTWKDFAFVAGSVRTATYNGQPDLTAFDFVVPDLLPGRYLLATCVPLPPVDFQEGSGSIFVIDSVSATDLPSPTWFRHGASGLLLVLVGFALLAYRRRQQAS